MKMKVFLSALIMSFIAVDTVEAAETRPAEGFALHVDAKLHFPGNTEMIAHHFCKPVAGGMTQCLIFETDDPDARLVGVEVIVGPDVQGAFSTEEKAMWHYHKTEIPKVAATMPDLSAEEAAKIVKNIEETYGKVYLLWDPSTNKGPTGSPSVSILE